MDIDLEAKKAWKSKRDKEPSAWRTARSAIKEAETPICAPNSEYSAFAMAGCILLATGLLLVAGGQAAQAYTTEQYVNAIYKVEGGAKTKYPYGIMVKYKHTTPRQACFNTVTHKRRDWVKAGRPGTFEHYLAVRYAPIGAANDPKGLNKNWERNLIAILKKENK